MRFCWGFNSVTPGPVVWQFVVVVTVVVGKGWVRVSSDIENL